MPQPLLDQPVVEVENRWVWKAFQDLSTTRPRGMGLGPISYRETMLYADELDLGPDLRDFLWQCIRKIDGVFLKMMNDKAIAEAEAERLKRQRNPRG